MGGVRHAIQGALLALALAGSVRAQEQPPAPAGDADARLKQVLDQELAEESRDPVAEARTHLRELQAARKVTPASDAAGLDKDLAYWQLKLELAQRQAALTGLRARVAAEQTQLSALQQQAQRDATADHASAAELRQRADQASAASQALRSRAQQAREQLDALRQELDGIAALQPANLDAARRDHDVAHYQRMRQVIDADFDQTRQLLSEQQLLAYALSAQAGAEEDLAAGLRQAAAARDTPSSRFFAAHEHELRAGGIALAALVVTWLLGLAGRALVAGVAQQAHRHGLRLSVQRFRTLQGFAQSILKVFVWVWALVAILGEFGVDPAKTGGAIGLFGLILAGMFQQIVIDFVKGLDIIAGRHYEVGDFIQVDGNYGHVLDFTAKYTVLRTPSGQLLQVPNSRCIPSRRFPDGCVDDYVDLTLARAGEAEEARERLAGVARELNERLEVLKEEPECVGRFNSADGAGLVLRYRLRVLPGCDWAAKDYFIPALQQALAREAPVELARDPSVVEMNGVERFRQLFARTLSEEEILRDFRGASPP